MISVLRLFPKRMLYHLVKQKPLNMITCGPIINDHNRRIIMKAGGFLCFETGTLQKGYNKSLVTLRSINVKNKDDDNKNFQVKGS